MLLQIPLDIPNVKIEKFEQSSEKGFVITVTSKQEGTKCKYCGKFINKFYGYNKEITLRHLPIFETPVWIKLKPKRYECPYCDSHPTTTQECSWYDQKSPHTKAYEQWILRDLINSSITDVSRRRGIGEGAIEGIVTRLVQQHVDWQAISSIPVLGIDEIALRKGHKDFVTMVYALDEQGHKHILAVLEDRKKETIKAFLEHIPTPQKATIKRVCVDMYDGFSYAVTEALPDAIVVVDRFHVAKNYRACADEARKEEMRRLKASLPEKQYAQLKGVMWDFRASWAELSKKPERQEVLLLLFSLSPVLQQIYVYREFLTTIFDKPLTKAQAIDKFNEWCFSVQALKLSCFDSFIETLQKWMDKITNYFIQRDSSGFVEGLNNKVKVIKRRCYGILNLDRLFQHIWLDVEGWRVFGLA